MTDRATQILALMADGKPRTVSQITDDLNGPDNWDGEENQALPEHGWSVVYFACHELFLADDLEQVGGTERGVLFQITPHAAARMARLARAKEA